MSDRIQQGYSPGSIGRSGTHGQQNAFGAAYNSAQPSPPINRQGSPSVPANAGTPYTNPPILYATEQDARQIVVQPTGAIYYAPMPNRQAIPTTQTLQYTGHAQSSQGPNSAQGAGTTSTFDPGGALFTFSLYGEDSSANNGQGTNKRPCSQCQKAQSRVRSFFHHAHKNANNQNLKCNMRPPFSPQQCERCRGKQDQCRFHSA